MWRQLINRVLSLFGLKPPKKRTAKSSLGDKAERIAGKHLKKQHYKLICYNYQTVFGEIDIIARRKDTLIFVEVRSLSSTGMLYPEETITRKKKNNVIRSAQSYMKRYKIDCPFQFDVIAVNFIDHKQYTLEHIENAF